MEERAILRFTAWNTITSYYAKLTSMLKQKQKCGRYLSVFKTSSTEDFDRSIDWPPASQGAVVSFSKSNDMYRVRMSNTQEWST